MSTLWECGEVQSHAPASGMFALASPLPYGRGSDTRCWQPRPARVQTKDGDNTGRYSSCACPYRRSDLHFPLRLLRDGKPHG